VDKVTVGRVKGLRIAVTAFVLSVILFIGGIFTTGYFLAARNSDNERFAKELHDGLVRNCKKNGNPLREAVQSQIREQIKQRQTFDYTKFFPSVPPAELKHLLEEQNRIDQARLKEIAPVPCTKIFPRP